MGSITSKKLLQVNLSRKNNRLEVSGAVTRTPDGRESRGVDIRQWYFNHEEQKWMPTKRGFYMQKEDFYAFLGAMGFDLADLDVDIKSFLDNNQKERIPILSLNG